MNSTPNEIDIQSPNGNTVNITHSTVVLPKVRGCNHRLDLSRLPRNTNCESCWIAFWNSNGSAVQTAEELLASGQQSTLEQIIGIKATKKLKQFLATVANFVETKCTTSKTLQDTNSED